MAITRISSQIAADAATLSMPSHAANDLLVAIIYRHDSTTAPTAVAGWKLRNSTNANSNYLAIYTKIATSGAETFGTWTNATDVAVAVYRSGSGKYALSSGSNSAGGSATTTINYAAIGANNLGTKDSFILGAVGIRTTGSNADTAPSGMTQFANASGATAGELAVHDTAAEVASWSSTNFTASSSVTYRSLTLGIQETEFDIPASGGAGGPLIQGRLVA